MLQLTWDRQNDQIAKVKENVTDIENKSFTDSLEASMTQVSLKDHSDGPLRPAYGSQGRKTILWANYFELLPDKNQPFYRYNVSFVSEKGEEPKGKKLERCVTLLLKQIPTTVTLATDYRQSLVASGKLPFEAKEFFIVYYSEEATRPDGNSPKYKAKIQYTGSFTFSDLLDYLSSTRLNRDRPSSRDEIIQATNIIIASGMKSNSQMITKRNKYFPAAGIFMEKRQIFVGLEAFRGFFMSVRAATARILLNVQVQHVVAWQAQPMSTLLTALTQSRTPLTEINRMITGLTVHVTHLRNRIKRVAGFALQGDGRRLSRPPKIRASYANAEDVFFWRESPEPARYVSVEDHFKETYFQLRYPGAYLLNVGTRADPIYMPAECCIIKSLQTFDKKLSPAATDDMRKFAVRYATQNAVTIVTKGIPLLQHTSQRILSAFNVGLDPSMITVHARILPGIEVKYSGTGRGKPRDGAWNMINTRFHQGATVNQWTFVWLKLKRNNAPADGGAIQDLDHAHEIVKNLQKTMTNCGMTVSDPLRAQEIVIQNTEEPDAEIQQLFESAANHKIRFLLCIVPNNGTILYNAIKRAGDVHCGIHTTIVVATQSKFCKMPPGPGIPNVQYHANVALKINLKFGGQNQVLQPQDHGFIGEGKTMLVGLDVTHPSPDSIKTAPSVSSITASIDRHLSQWPADISIQTGRKEIIVGLKKMIQSRLTLWQEHNGGRLPEEMIIYRDGVGEGMYELVRTEELSLIRAACKEFYSARETKENKPYISIIICGKRHHTRFYPTNQADADNRTGGTLPGTIVDRGVTEARVWDFYFQPHKALQGTPRSAHYVVIHDEIFRRRARDRFPRDVTKAGQTAADEVQRLTNALSYMYGRATKAVSLCPPAYYADIACERARAWLSGVFEGKSTGSSQAEVREADVRLHANLKDTMFYI